MLWQLGVNGQVAIVCGKGNNAGDGFVLARHLDNLGVKIRLVMLASPTEFTSDAKANYRTIAAMGVPQFELSPEFAIARLPALVDGCEWIVDAMLGTGALGEPRDPMATAIAMLNDATGNRLAIDIPSGLDCDTGQPSRNTFRAHHTCTFVAQKTGFAAPEAKPYLGEVHVIDIGVPRRLVQSLVGREAKILF